MVRRAGSLPAGGVAALGTGRFARRIRPGSDNADRLPGSSRILWLGSVEPVPKRELEWRNAAMKPITELRAAPNHSEKTTRAKGGCPKPQARAPRLARRPSNFRNRPSTDSIEHSDRRPVSLCEPSSSTPTSQAS